MPDGLPVKPDYKFTYTNPKDGSMVHSPRRLSDDELMGIFAKPLSADPQARDHALSTTKTITDQVKSGASLSTVRKALSEPEGRKGAAQAVADVTRVGGALAGGAVGHPFVGAAAGDVAAQGIEMLSGSRGGYSPGETALNTVIGGYAPGMEGSVAAGVGKGAVFGAASTTLNSLYQTGKVPTVGRLALGTAAGALMVGGGRRLLRPATYELSTADVARETHAILSGEELSPEAASVSVKEDARAIQKMLPGIKKEPAGLGYGKTVRLRSGRFGSMAGLHEDYNFPSDDIEIHQPELPFRRGTEGPRQSTKEYVGQLRVGIPKAEFGRIERNTGVETYSGMFDPIHQARLRASDFNSSRAEEMHQAFEGVGVPHKEKYEAWLESPDKSRAEDLLQFERGDHIRARSLQQSYDRMFRAYGLEDGGAPAGMTRSDEYLTQHRPAMRWAHIELEQAGNPEPTPAQVLEKAFPVGVPKSVQFFKEAYEGEYLHPRDTNSETILSRHLDFGSHKTFVQPSIDDARQRFVNNPNLPDGLKGTVKTYLDQVEGSARDTLGRDMGIAVSKAFGRLGYKISPEEARASVNSYLVSGQYGGTLGWRIGPRFRNFLQTWQTGFSELGSYWFVGERASRSAAGQQLARQLGALSGEQSLAAEAVRGTQMQPKTLFGKGARLSAKMTEKSLVKYQSTDELNRSIMALGQYARATNAMRKAGGNVNKFIDRAWFDSGIFQPGERDVLIKLAKEGKWHEAARRSAVGLADNTQWSYLAGNRPPVTAGTGGRMAMGYYSWGAFYANYLRRIASPAEFAGHPGKQAVRLARFLGANAALMGAGVAVGKALGVQDSWNRVLSWSFLSPAVYTLDSPIKNMVEHGARAANEVSQGQFGGPNMKRFAEDTTSFIPGAGMVKDFMHLVKPDKGEAEAVARTSGMLPRTAP